MKGVVFNLLEEAVSSEFGAKTWDDLLDAAGLDGAYTSLGSYPDEEVFKLVTAASNALNLSPSDILRWFGQRAMPMLANRYPVFFKGHDTTRSFLLTLNKIIHPEVKKLYPGAAPPVFDFDTSNADSLRIGYRSERKLCALAEGFMQGAADHYSERMQLEQPECMHHGAAKCVFLLRFPGKASASVA